MYSTPQKHPAAMVAVCAPAGTLIGCAGAEDIADDVKGRSRRVRNDIELQVRTARKIVARSRNLKNGEFAIEGEGFEWVFYVLWYPAKVLLVPR